MRKAIKTVSELQWKAHPIGSGEHAVEIFKNGYEASVIKGGMFHTRGGTYEIAIIHPSEGICYDTGLTDDVFGYLSEDEANKALVDISELPPRKNIVTQESK